MSTIKGTQITMKEFREAIDSDEQMMLFAANNLDAPDDAIVEIQVNGQFVTFGIVSHGNPFEGDAVGGKLLCGGDTEEHEQIVKLDFNEVRCHCGWKKRFDVRATAENQESRAEEIDAAYEAHLKA